jgi:tetratricopeptide (TPR) repeat protein
MSQKVNVKIKGDKNAVTITQKYGLDVNEARDIANEIAKPYKEANTRLFQESIDLKNQLISAIQRAAEAEDRISIPEANGIIEELRKTGDTKRLLDVLIKERDKNKNELIERNNEIGAVAYLRRETKIALDATEQVLALEPNNLKSMNQKGLILSLQGKLDEAEEIHRKYLNIAQQIGNQRGMAIGYGNLGIIYQERGKLNEAEEMHKKALEIDERIGHQEGIADDFGNLGCIYLIRGEFDKAEEMFKKSLEIAEKIGLSEVMADQYGNLGTIYEQKGDLEKARWYWEKARDLFKKIGMPNEVKEVEECIEKIKKK